MACCHFYLTRLSLIVVGFHSFRLPNRYLESHQKLAQINFFLILVVFGPLVLFLNSILLRAFLLLFKIVMLSLFSFLGEILFISFSFRGDTLIWFPSS